MKRLIAPAVFCFLFFGVGIAVFIWGFDGLRCGWAGKSWPTVEGTVRSSMLGVEDDTDGVTLAAFVVYE